MMKKKVLSREQQRARGKLIAEDGRAGMHVHELSDKYGITTARIRHWLLVHDVAAVRCSCLRQKGSIARVIALRQRGMLQMEIAKELGISRQRVCSLCKQAREAGVQGC